MKSKYRPDIESRGWMTLDNAAKIYPSVMGKELSSVFRLECRLTAPVKINSLLKAVEKVSNRFPYYLTTLRQGLFWYFLEYEPELRPPVLAEEERPCVAFPAKIGKNALFRIVVHGNRLSVEFLHILADAGGAIEYLKSLIVTYLNICGHQIPYSEGIIEPDSPILRDEAEDSFNKYFDKKVPFPGKLKTAWHLPFPMHSPYRLSTTSLLIDSMELKSRASEYKLTVTEFLISIYTSCLQEIWYGSKKNNPIIRVSVPVNMRAKLESKSMRNFSLFVTPEINMRLGNYNFEEITRMVHNYMQQRTEKKLLSKSISRNVKPERAFLLRIVPLFIKSFILSHHFKKDGARMYTGVLTNLGIVRMPVESEEHIESFLFFPPPPTHDLKVSCGVATYKTNMIITFANITVEKEVEKRFSAELIKRDIKVKILNNPFHNEKKDLS